MTIRQSEPDDEPVGEQREGGRHSPRNGANPGAGHEGSRPYAKQLLWFIALWLLGVVSTALLVLPFHLLVSSAIHR
ncbi:hypothetical protein [Caballeronia ptereochthonis]|uniref:Uncharacterized protein n=1 Tax=Caballeronia ptereochthonis TaxID=1777144 RepID=A0A158CB62_9BURK|nr:hypothetical protein [Caballeronia ptereochthonis]SAK79530.1 hypothetical protein AWB83_04157 [Caballeronia ptereochthonis]